MVQDDISEQSFGSEHADEYGDAPELARLVQALCVIRIPDEAHAFLSDLLSLREMTELARRLEVARMLHQGSSYVEVSHTTGASSTTVSRVSKCLNGSKGGYRLVLDRLAGSTVATDLNTSAESDTHDMQQPR